MSETPLLIEHLLDGLTYDKSQFSSSRLPALGKANCLAASKYILNNLPLSAEETPLLLVENRDGNVHYLGAALATLSTKRYAMFCGSVTNIGPQTRNLRVTYPLGQLLTETPNASEFYLDINYYHYTLIPTDGAVGVISIPLGIYPGFLASFKDKGLSPGCWEDILKAARIGEQRDH